MRLPLFLLAFAICCDAPIDNTNASAFCASLAAQNEGCWTPELDDDCLDVYAECGQEILILESCPVQLACN